MTNEQKEKIIELRKLGIGYRSIATAMNMSRDKVRNFCKAQGLDGYGKNNEKADGEKTIRELCKTVVSELIKSLLRVGQRLTVL